LFDGENISFDASLVLCACETWVLKENSIQKLMIFERKILRKIFGPTKEVNGKI
jgi:hypothetical protein